MGAKAGGAKDYCNVCGVILQLGEKKVCRDCKRKWGR